MHLDERAYDPLCTVPKNSSDLPIFLFHSPLIGQTQPKLRPSFLFPLFLRGP